MESAERLKKIPPYLFMELRQKIGRARAAGMDVISLAIGDPVEPTPDPVIEELGRAAHDPANHRYPTDEEKGMLGFRDAVAHWYARRYQVAVDPRTEVLGLIGSKEGCHHFALARVNPGDTVLMTDPGYPAYRASILIAGGEPVNVPIRPEHGYLPALRDIPSGHRQAGDGDVPQLPEQPDRRRRDAGVPARAGRVRPQSRHRHLLRQPVHRDGLRRREAAELPVRRGRQGRRRRAQLALQAVQHDRLAPRHGARQSRI